MRRRILITLGLVTLTIAGLVWNATRPGAPLKVTASFIDYTNNLAGVRLARLKVTNHSGVRVYRWGSCHLGNEQPKGLYPVFIGSDAFLAPEQSEVVVVPAPTNQVRWLAGINISRDDWRRQFSFFAGSLPPLIKSLIPQMAQGVPTELALTDWIDP
jgi:hypothetical protein